MRFKKVISGILACVMFLTTMPVSKYTPVIEAHAFASVNAGGGGSSGGSGGGVGQNTVRTLESHTSGIRITLVDPNTGLPVSKTVDILYSTPPMNTRFFTKSRSEFMELVRTGDLDGISDDFSNFTWLTNTRVNQLLVEAGYGNEIARNPFPMWYARLPGNVHTGVSEPFQRWFCSKEAMDAFISLRRNMNKLDKSVQDTSDAINVMENTEDFGEFVDAHERAMKGVAESLEFYKAAYNDVQNVIASGDPEKAREAIDLFSQSWQSNGSLNVQYEFQPESFLGDMTTLENLYRKKFSDLEKANMGGLLNTSDNSEHENILDKIDDIFTLTAYASPVVSAGKSDSTDDTDFDRLKEEITPSKGETIGNQSGGGMSSTSAGMHKEDTSNSTINNLPEDFYTDAEKKHINVEKYGFAYALFQLEIGGKSLFAQNKESGYEIMQKFLSGEAYAIVEPILFFQAEGTRNYPQYFYGTPAAYGWFSMNVLMPWDSITGSGGDIFRGPNIVFINAFELSDDEEALAPSYDRVPFLNGAAYFQGGRPAQTYGRYKTARYRGETIWDYAANDIGMGMHIYALPGGESTSMINTYDIVNNPTHDDNSEPASEKPPESEEYTTVDKNRKFQIVKFYRVKYGDKYREWSYYSQGNTPHIVQITDEIDIGWKLVEWFTSPSEWMPENGGDPKKYPWESYVKGNNPQGTYSGTEEELLTVYPDDPDNTLYLLYELEKIEEKDDKVTVIRVYDDEEGTTQRVEKEITDQNPYTVPDGGDYIYTETKITPNSPNDTHTWNDSEGETQGSPETITYPEGTKTIYIHYIKLPVSPETKKIILWENELSYNYDLRDLLKERKLIGIYDNVPWPGYMWKSCGGHSCGGSRCRGRHKCTNRTKGLSERNWTVAVQDTFDENTLPFIKDWTYISEMSKTGRANDEGGNGKDATVTPQATYLLIRNKQDDVVTLYPGKNESLLSELSQLNLSENYTSSDTRYEKKRETAKTEKYYRTLHTGLAYGAGRDTEMTWWTLLYGSYGSHSNSGKFYSSPLVSPDDANAAYSKENNVETRYFLGQAGKGEEEPSDIRSSWNKKFSRNTSYAKTSADLSFYPYLKYLYYYKDNTTPNDVMVTSSNLSSLKVFNAIQAGVYKKNEINANLTSTQWSTHARSLAFLNTNSISDKKSVLPGGAIQDIDMGNKGDTQIGVTLWQACLPDGQVQAVQEGFKVSETEARTAANALVEEIKKSISGYGLVQWGEVGTYTDFRSIIDSGEELHESTSVSLVTGNSGRTASDDKYYLRHDGTGSSRANFDVLDSRIENQFVYTIYSDTEGNVWVTKDGTELGRISKTEDASKLLQNAELKLLDDNTKLITNYISCIQRNIGNARDGSTWHNEAFDGVSVLMTDISFDVGFGGDSSKRTNVLDTLLVAKAQSKSDLYNFADESNIRSSVYVTTKTSSQAVKPDQEGYLGTLKAVAGMGDLETGLTDIQSMVYTKNFYIPNATVSDLN